MWCMKCNHDLGECTCPDLAERLASIANDPAGRVAMKWCRTCDKHYAKCSCAAPDFYVRRAGREMPIPEGGFPNAAGSRTMPDLKRK